MNKLLTLFSDDGKVGLPQNLLTNAGTLYEDFETAGDWSVTSGSVAANTTQFKTGTQSMKLTSNAGATSRMTKTVNWDLSGNWQRMTLWFYLHNTTLTDYAGSIIIYLGNDTGVNDYMRTWLSTSSIKTSGWHTLHCAKADFSQGNAGTFANPIIRVRFECKGATSIIAAASFDSLYFGGIGVPGVIVDFDDGYASNYTTCYGYMKPLGIVGNIAVETDVSNISTDQYLEMNSAGWCMVNHTNAATVLTTLSEADQETHIAGGKTALDGWGLTKGSNYLVYPGGGNNSDTITAMTNLGVLLGRNTGLTNAVGCAMLALPFAPMTEFPSNGVDSGTSVATVTGLIDKAIAGGYIMPFHWHDVGGSGQMTAANFRLCMDYIYTKWKAGLIYPLTYDDLYNAGLGPIRVRK